MTSASVFSAYLYLTQYDKQNYAKELNEKYSFISNALLFYMNHKISKEDLDKQLRIYKMSKVKDVNQKFHILKRSELVQEIRVGFKTFSILRYDKQYYLFAQDFVKSMLLKDVGYNPYRYDEIKLIFAGIFFVILLTYLLTIRKLKPLQRLKHQIDKFAKGDLEGLDCKIKGKDEIAQVANAFDNAVEQIRKLNSSRQLFLRNIMHELKTPITKGLITLEMIEKSKYQERLTRSFERLESLINEFATVEQVSSKMKLEKKKKYRLDDLFDEAVDLAMVDKECVELRLEDSSLCVNFKFFCVALKNMIDNGIKYSSDGRIKILASSQSIHFISQGEALKKPLSYYTEPFNKEGTKEKSFGLGLYIVKNILKLHDMKLSYKNEDGFNVFSFVS